MKLIPGPNQLIIESNNESDAKTIGALIYFLTSSLSMETVSGTPVCFQTPDHEKKNPDPNAIP